MNEADEVALNLALELQLDRVSFRSLDNAREIVRMRMPDETAQVIDNVAEALWRTQL